VRLYLCKLCRAVLAYDFAVDDGRVILTATWKCPMLMGTSHRRRDVEDVTTPERLAAWAFGGVDAVGYMIGVDRTGGS
jgi:hypothetical protein